MFFLGSCGLVSVCVLGADGVSVGVLVSVWSGLWVLSMLL